MNRIWKRLHRQGSGVAIFTLILVAFALAPGNQAEAGTFPMRQCEGANFRDLTATPLILGGVDRVDIVSGCSAAQPTKIGVYQDRKGSNLAYGVGGEFNWVLPPGTEVIATKFDAKLKDANGIVARLAGRGGGGVITQLDAGLPHDGVQRTVRWSGANPPLSIVQVRLVCESTGGCANQPASAKAFVEAFDVEMTVSDFRAPQVTPSGSIWDWTKAGGWHRGDGSIRVKASDQGAGIARSWAEVNGLRVDVGTTICTGARSGFVVAVPVCPTNVEPSRSLDTSRTPFTEGENRVRVCVADYASSPADANQTCGASGRLLVDNLAPANPVDLKVSGESGWRAENRFELDWGNPGNQVSPIIGGEYRILDPDSSEPIETGDFDGDSPAGLGPLAVPGAGEYEVEVRLLDGAGNLGEPARTTLRFDDRPPGDVVPESPAGWISADELPLRQVIARAASGGPSGVGGYALSVSGDGPRNPCPLGICTAPDLALSGGIDDRTGIIPGLAEGTHWVSAVAASGAGVASENPGSTTVNVDRTPPSVRLDGAPSGWVNRPVVLTANATDAASGMSSRPGEDDGEPVTVIEVQDHAPYRAPGGAASFTVSSEGVSRVRYWARDLAGNANDGKPGGDGIRHQPPGESVVRIDTEPPTPTFSRVRDPADPELLRVQVEDGDSGVRSVVISWRPAGSAKPFAPLATREAGDHFEARMPSDDLPDGSYEIRAEATDRAGNEGLGFMTEDGAPMLLTLPLKERVKLNAGLGSRSRVAVKAGFKGRPVVAGRLTGRDGAGIPGASLTVEESFFVGSGSPARTTKVVTDGVGRFAVKLRPGTGRKVKVGFPGSRVRSRATSRTLTIRSRGKVTFRITPSKLRNGGGVQMRGRVALRGALLPARGKLVAIQYLDPSRRKWRPVEVLRTGRKGAFKYRYRFRTIASAQRIKFRAVSLAESGWPYLRSTSRSRSVIVFPKGQ